MNTLLTNYLADLDFWSTCDPSSVNHYTNGTPSFSTSEEIETYRTRVRAELETVELTKKRLKAALQQLQEYSPNELCIGSDDFTFSISEVLADLK